VDDQVMIKRQLLATAAPKVLNFALLKMDIQGIIFASYFSNGGLQ